MAINVRITKQGTENSASVLRKFSYKVRSSGVLMKARKQQVRERQKSRNMRKYATLKRLAKKAEILRLVKEGKLKARAKRAVATSVSGK